MAAATSDVETNDKMRRWYEQQLKSHREEKALAAQHRASLERELDEIDQEINKLKQRRSYVSRSFWFTSVYMDKCSERIYEFEKQLQ